jgi:hypothetical protein
MPERRHDCAFGCDQDAGSRSSQRVQIDVRRKMECCRSNDGRPMVGDGLPSKQRVTGSQLDYARPIEAVSDLKAVGNCGGGCPNGTAVALLNLVLSTRGAQGC